MTMQRADQGQFGSTYEVVPMTAYTVRNQVSCFKVDGGSDAPVSIQGVLPDLTGFQVSLLAIVCMVLTVALFDS